MSEKVEKKHTKKKRTEKWELTNASIRDFILNYLKEKKKMPTQSEIAKGIGVSTKTIERHYEDIDFEFIKSPYRSLTPEVLAGLFAASRRGSAPAVKLWFQIIEGWKEKTGFEHSGPEGEAIGINTHIYIPENGRD